MKTTHPPIFAFIAALSLATVAQPIRAETIARASNDAQLLQAYVAPVTLSLDNYGSNRTACTGADPTDGQTVNKDCSEAAAPYIKVSWSDRMSPSLSDWKIPYYNSRGYVGSHDLGGQLVELRVLVKKSVLSSPIFTGIGFYRSNMIESGKVLIPKDKLHVVSDANAKLVLKDSGDEAVVLRFVMYFPGYAGNSGTGWCMDSVTFKPFASFKNGESTFENWDSVPNNHQIYRCSNAGGTEQINSIDRATTLLK